MNSNYLDFDVAIEKYFRKYLVAEISASANTVRNYRDTFILLLEYFQKKLGISPEKISLEVIDRELICDFLNWLESDLNCSVSTRNHRYATLRSFFNYMMYLDPIHLSQWKLICSIKKKKGPIGEMNYLTVDGMKCLLEQIDTETLKGRRDLTLLSLLYNTGARVQELIDLTPNSIRMVKPFTVELFGKGSKKRIVPIDESMQKLLNRYLDECGLKSAINQNSPLFFNARHQKLTTPGVTYVIQKYADMARESHPELIPKKISPHCFRHSKAMHLLQAECPLIYIRDLLGHVSIMTTEVYARTDSLHKRKALESAYEKVGITEPSLASWEKDPKLKAFLKSLG